MITEEHISHAAKQGWHENTIRYWKDWLEAHGAVNLSPHDFEFFIRRNESSVGEAIGDTMLPSWRKPEMTSEQFISAFVKANPDMPEEHREYFDRVVEDLGDLKRDLDNTFLAAKRVIIAAENLSDHTSRIVTGKGIREKVTALREAIQWFNDHKDAVT